MPYKAHTLLGSSSVEPHKSHIFKQNHDSSRVMARRGRIFFHLTVQVGSGRVGSGRVRRFSNSHGSGRAGSPLPDPTRPDLTREVRPDP